MNENNKHYCHSCDGECEIVIRDYSTTLDVLGIKRITVESPVAFCAECGGDVFDKDLDNALLEKVYARFKEETGYSVEEYKRLFLSR